MFRFVVIPVLLLWPPWAAQAREHWRFAIEESAGSVQHVAAVRFAELVHSRTSGEVEVTVYPYGTLGTSDQVTELLAMGTIQFAMASPGHLGKIIPEVQAFLLHFLLTDDEGLNQRIFSDPALAGVLDGLYREKGLAFLSMFSEGWQVWTTQRAIRGPEDFNGLRMRVMTSPLLIAAYEAYGASPTPLPYGEVYSALQLNMIDGQENPIFAIEEMSFHEVVDFIVQGRHAPFVATMAANGTFLDELDPARRTMVREVVAEVEPFILESQRRFNAERLQRILEERPSVTFVEALSPEAREAFRAASAVVVDRYLALAGPRGRAMLDAIGAARARALGDEGP